MRGLYYPGVKHSFWVLLLARLHSPSSATPRSTEPGIGPSSRRCWHGARRRSLPSHLLTGLRAWPGHDGQGRALQTTRRACGVNEIALARRTRPLLHDQPRAVGGHLHANPILFRTLSNPESWNVASWPTPGQSDTLIFSWAPSGSDRRSPTASPL